MTDLAVLDSKIRARLERVPLSAIVIVLKAIHDELKFRNRTPRPPGLRSRGAEQVGLAVRNRQERRAQETRIFHRGRGI